MHSDQVDPATVYLLVAVARRQAPNLRPPQG